MVQDFIIIINQVAYSQVPGQQPNRGHHEEYVCPAHSTGSAVSIIFSERWPSESWRVLEWTRTETVLCLFEIIINQPRDIHTRPLPI